MKKIYFATSNRGKFNDVSRFMRLYAPHITLEQFEADIPEMQSYDQKAVALAKAQAAWQLLKKPVLVDDAGIYFTRYDRFPGVLTKYVFMGLGNEGVMRLFESGDSAYFLLYFVLYYSPNEFEFFESKREGILVHQDKFLAPTTLPYDRFFVPTGFDMTYAEMRVKDETLFHKEDVRIPAVKRCADWLDLQGNKIFELP